MKSERDKERYEWYKSHGICVHCGQREAECGRVMCLICWDKQTEINRKRILTAEQKQSMKEYMAKKREKWKADGLCIECGKKPHAENRVKCHNCLRKDNKRKIKHYRKRGRLPWELRGNGYCYFCCRPIDSGKKSCDECHEKFAAIANENRQKVDYINHPFRTMKWSS